MWLPSIFAFFSEMEHYKRALHRRHKSIRDTQKYGIDCCAETHCRWKSRGCCSLSDRRSRPHNAVTAPNAGEWRGTQSHLGGIDPRQGCKVEGSPSTDGI